MPSFYKVAVQGTYGGQSIVNVLYYTEDGVETVPAGGGDADAFLTALEARFVAGYLGLMPAGHVIESLTLTRVNEFNETISDYPVEKQITKTGTNATPADGQFLCLIASARCDRLTTAPTIPVPKRSYIAWGPVVNSIIGNNGESLLSPAQEAIITTALFTGFTANALDYVPARVGRGAAGGAARAGLVDSLVYRPYASIRKSRKNRPTGEGI